jgi:hypothetical protein
MRSKSEVEKSGHVDRSAKHLQRSFCTQQVKHVTFTRLHPIRLIGAMVEGEHCDGDLTEKVTELGAGDADAEKMYIRQAGKSTCGSTDKYLNYADLQHEVLDNSKQD